MRRKVAIRAIVAAGALSGAAGNAVDQGFNILDGTQNGFSFKQLGVSAALGGGLGYIGAKVAPAFMNSGTGRWLGLSGRAGTVEAQQLETITEQQFVNNAASNAVKVAAQDGSYVIYSTQVATKTGETATIEFGGIVTKTETQLIIDKLDIQGAAANMLGPKKLIEVAKQLGKQEGVQEVIINGAKRTTGANPG